MFEYVPNSRLSSMIVSEVSTVLPYRSIDDPSRFGAADEWRKKNFAGTFGLPRRADDPADDHLRGRSKYIIDENRCSAADSQGGPIGPAEIAPTGGSSGRPDAGGHTTGQSANA